MLNRLTGTVQRLLGGKPRDTQAVFTRIYERNSWGSDESVSGVGSTRARGESFTLDVLALLQEIGARVLLDAPCGDMNWASEIADSVDEYVGVDIVHDLIDRNSVLHGRPGRRFVHADLIRDALPRADVVLCRDALVHFSDEDAWDAIRNIKRSCSKFILTTSFVDHETNARIATGRWRPLNLERAPFLFPPPLVLVDEHCLHSGGIYKDKRLALWDLASLPDGPPTYRPMGRCSE